MATIVSMQKITLTQKTAPANIPEIVLAKYSLSDTSLSGCSSDISMPG
jgi:hypothetical protein